ncbi:MAG: hypothetical protein JW838_10835 [Spirochaetes bacterium]|nr:hypothetical protein [Spirochaetota bacterium]
MLPIVDYGGIAIVIPKVAAVGNIIEDSGRYGFEVYLSGMNEPLVIGFDSEKEAAESRNELIGIIAQFHYVREMGPDYDMDDMNDEDAPEGEGERKSEKH